MDKYLLAVYNALIIGTYWEELDVYRDVPYLGASLFPSQKKRGLDLAWLKGKNQIPVVLQPSAFDTKAAIRDRIGVKEVQESMPFFREGMRIGERDRQELMNYLEKGESYVKPMLQKLYDDNANLLDGAIAQVERMRMSLITTGKIYIAGAGENGRPISHEYVYDVDGSWYKDNVTQLMGESQWTVANKATSNPIQDLLDMMEEVKLTGTMPTTVIMNTATLNGALASESIIKSINPLGAPNMIMSNAKLKQAVEDSTGLKIVVYDKIYKDENGVTKKYMPDGYTVMLPNGTLGSTWFGTTPEEFDLLNMKEEVVTGKDAPNGPVSCYTTGQGPTVTTIKEAHPVNIQTIVSMIILPSFERMKDVFVMKVIEGV